MKVVADVEIVNRLLPSAGMRSKGRAARSQLSIGHGGSGSSDVSLLICTQQNRLGTKFSLKNNIECVFAKFINEGKCTVRLRDPAHDICISKADTVQLKGFLSLLKVASSGQSIDGVKFAPLLPATKTQVTSLKTKLVISARAEYPVTSGFPTGLESLTVHSCSLKRVDSRIFNLTRLTSLDLSDNHIVVLPDDWNALKNLADLRLARNKLSAIPPGLFLGSRLNTLAYLDLSGNQLNVLPGRLIDLRSLAVLKLDENKLECLPHGIGRLRRLVQLSAARNSLQTLPADFDQLTLQELDLFGNPFVEYGQSSLQISAEASFPSLFELAARCVKNKRVPYTAADVGRRVADIIDNASVCWKCNSACLIPHAIYRRCVDLRRVSASVTAVDTVGRTRVPADAVLCSPGCVARTGVDK